jgi:heptaprenyl diphosphate synthase
MLSGAPQAVVEMLTRYGERIGVAFQLSDDLIDVASTTVQSGKTPGTDLREGVRTLPVLLALASTTSGDAELRDLLAERLDDDVRLSRALELLRRSTAMKAARVELVRWAGEAREAIEPLPDCPAKEALVQLCEVVVSRSG